jgi:hypothetical protein
MTAMLKMVAPTVLLLEGGYNLNATAEATEACLRVLLGETPGNLPGPRHASTAGCRGIQQAIQVQARYWQCLRATSELLAVRAMPAAAAGGGASAQPSDNTQQLPARASGGAPGDGSGPCSGGATLVTSAKLRAVAPHHHHRHRSIAKHGRVLLAIHKRAMIAFWKRKRRLASSPAPMA